MGRADADEYALAAGPGPWGKLSAAARASHSFASLQRSNSTSVSGRAQQISTFPSAGGSSGSGSYHTDPPINAHSHVWQTPVRHDHFTRTSQASANSSRLWYVGLHGTSRPLRAKETMGPGPVAPAG